MNLSAIFSRPENKKAVSVLNDPFKASSIERIFIVWRKPYYDGADPALYADVAFQSGNTKGEQKIEATTFPELMVKIQAFIESLPKK